MLFHNVTQQAKYGILTVKNVFVLSYLHREFAGKLSGDGLASHEDGVGRLVPNDAVLQQVWWLWGGTVES